jgi:NAD dependent epimerase/dehydratase
VGFAVSDSGKVLVTGADGFIGSHLTETLVHRGYDVRALVMYNSLNSWGWLEDASDEVRAQVEVVAGDLRDPDAMRAAVSGCSRVAHLGALIAIPYSYTAPASYVETNVTGTLNVLQAARAADVERIVHTSTSEVYGTAQYVPMDEQHPLQAQSPYAATKIAADQLALSFYRSFEVPVTVIRPFNTFGPRQSARAVIPTIITQILNGQRELRLGALSPTRDFCYVADTVAAFVTMLESDNVLGEVVNFGTGTDISIGRAVELIGEELGADITISCDEARLRPPGSEVERLCAATNVAHALTGWRATYGGEDGFRRAIGETAAWFQSSQNLGRYKSDLYNV